MKITNIYIGVIEKIYKKDNSEVIPVFKTCPERQTVLHLIKEKQVEDLKFGGIYKVGITNNNEVGDYIVSEQSLVPMFSVDLSDSVFQDEENLEITKQLVLKIYNHDIEIK